MGVCYHLLVATYLLGSMPFQALGFVLASPAASSRQERGRHHADHSRRHHDLYHHYEQRTRRRHRSSSRLYEICNNDHQQQLDSETSKTASSDESSPPSSSSFSRWTQAQLEDFASSQGVVLSLTTLGPGYRAVARSKHNTTQILGYVEGFVRPGNVLLHVDKMEVFRRMVKRARLENPDEFRGGGTVLGVGLLIGYLCMLHGDAQGCRTAEFLAIDDEDFQHKRLVRYYKQAGFEFVKYVGDGFADIPDRLV